MGLLTPQGNHSAPFSTLPNTQRSGGPHPANIPKALGRPSSSFSRLSCLPGACEQPRWWRFETEPQPPDKTPSLSPQQPNDLSCIFAFPKARRCSSGVYLRTSKRFLSLFCCCRGHKEPTARMWSYKRICCSKQLRALCCAQGPRVDSALFLGGFLPPCEFEDVNLGGTRPSFLYVCWPEAGHAEGIHRH